MKLDYTAHGINGAPLRIWTQHTSLYMYLKGQLHEINIFVGLYIITVYVYCALMVSKLLIIL
jgi:hypothetical protein